MPESDLALPFQVIVSPKRRRIAFRIGEKGVLEVLSPPGVSPSFLRRLVEREAPLIEKLRQKSAMRKREKADFSEGSFFPCLGRYYPIRFSRRVRLFDGEAFLLPQGEEAAIRENLIALYKELAFSYLSEHLPRWQEVMGVQVEKIRINSASSRWGSCSSRGTICFSWKLIQCPPELVEYVMIHELAHRRELNHSDRFWAIVASFCPDLEERKEALKRFSLRLPEI